MKLRNIDFGPVCGASGVQGFFGEGYPWHKLAVGLDFTGMTFVAKTVTLDARKGNMDDRLIPRCIIAKPFGADPVALNSVGLTNKGIDYYLAQKRWQERPEPFMLSFMSVEVDRKPRLNEFGLFLVKLEKELPSFQAPVALQINVSCPNTGHRIGDLKETIREAREYLNRAEGLGIPILLKISVELSPVLAAELESHEELDGICVSNTIPWRALEDRVDWDRYFGSDPESPLKKRGFTPGGLSGAPLFPLVLEWVQDARRIGFSKAINAGGGILKPQNAIDLLKAGANSVFIGSCAFLRPCKVQPIIIAAREFAKR